MLCALHVQRIIRVVEGEGVELVAFQILQHVPLGRRQLKGQIEELGVEVLGAVGRRLQR